MLQVFGCLGDIKENYIFKRWDASHFMILSAILDCELSLRYDIGT